MQHLSSMPLKLIAADCWLTYINALSDLADLIPSTLKPYISQG
jgi:hypothetical protein